MRKEMNVLDEHGILNQKLPRGILLNTKADGEFNTMVIGWGFLGRIWNKPMYVALVRTSRYTHDLLEKNPEFTISAPAEGGLTPEMLKVAGSQSGRDVNKAEALKLTLVDSDIVSVPGIKELPVTLECKVVYKQDLDARALPEFAQKNFYPDVFEEVQDPNNTIHTMYFGEIVKAYTIED